MPLNFFDEPMNRKGVILGCSTCPLDKVPNLNKVKGLVRIKGRKAMLWAQSPGKTDNRLRKELIGPVGEFLWEGLGYHGLTRDMFDVQNVLRCRPLGEIRKVNGKEQIFPSDQEHDPTKRELQCCSIYNEEALKLNQGNALVHLILGDTAGEALLEKDFNKEVPIMWYEPWESYLVFNIHPSLLLRKGGKQAGWAYRTWRDRFLAVKTILKYPGRWGYVKSRNYQLVNAPEKFRKMKEVLVQESKAGRNVSLDFEDCVVDGKHLILVAGFGTGHFENPKDTTSWKGQAWSVVLDHSASGYSVKQLDEMKELTHQLIKDTSIKKTLQNGSHDDKASEAVFGSKIGAYEYDTRYGTYLRHSFFRSYSLETQQMQFFPEFCDYKETVNPWYNEGRYSETPLDRLLLRNAGDCDVTQRLEQKFSPQIRKALVKVYIHAGKTLDKMQQRGPVLDRPAWNKANTIVPKLIEKVENHLKRVSRDLSFDVNKPEQVQKLVYETLGLPEVEEHGRSTAKLVLEMLLAENPDALPLDFVMKGRGLKKIKSTYLKAYELSARMHDEELRTVWHLCGAVTGRLRSGKGDDGDAKGIINFQNLHGNPLLQNLLVADSNWRDVFKFLAANPGKPLPPSLLDTEILLAADGSQIELRGLAELANDKLLISQFIDAAKDRSNPLKDVHCQVGHMMTGWPLERIKDDKKTRRVCKNVHFGIAFGLGEDSVYGYVVAKMRAVDGPNVNLSDITPARMKKLHRMYFKKYTGVKQFIIDQRLKAESQGFVETLFGFRSEIFKDDDGRTTYWGNQAINRPVQGTAHQFLLIALALLDLKPKTYWALQKIIMEVHDALYFRIKLRHLAEGYTQLMHLFETGAYSYAQEKFGLKLRVPLLAEATAGMTMGSMVSYEGQKLEEFLPLWLKEQQKVEKLPLEAFMPVSSAA